MSSPESYALAERLTDADPPLVGHAPTGTRPAGRGKHCHACGADVAAQARFKDDKGYWCAPCAEADSARRKGRATQACAACGRRVQAKELISLGQRLVCDLCAESETGDELPSLPDPSDDTSILSSQGEQKACCVCGADLTNRRRLHDENGYWCEPCHANDVQARKQAQEEKQRNRHRLRCLDCGVKVPAHELREVNGIEMCPNCVAARRERARVEKQEVSRRGTRTRSKFAQADAAERQRRRKRLFVAGAVILALTMLSLYQNGLLATSG